MNIVISVNNNAEAMVMPVVPPDIEINKPWENEEKKSVKNGAFTIIGLSGLVSFSLESFWPVNKDYPFTAPGALKDGNKYVDFFERWRPKRVPFRVVITDKEQREVLNLPMTVENFSYSYDKVGDINYKLDFKEYKFIK